MQQLARAIRKQIDLLVDRYDARLCTMPGYDRLPETARRDLERHFLNIIAQCLEKGDDAELVEHARQRAVQWETQGLNLVWFQQALIIPEELLVPLIQSVAASNFVWRALNRSQKVIWQMMADHAQHTEERFRSIVETSHSGVLIADDTFHLTYANDEAARISGYTREELLNTDFRQLFDEESRRMVLDYYLRRQRGEAIPPRYQIVFKRKDGSERFAEMSAVTLQEAGGKIYTVAQVLDITEQKQAQAALAQERNLLRTLIDNVPDQIFFKDAQGRVILNNLADAHALRVNSPEEAVGKSDFDFYPPELAERYHADDMAVIQSGQPLFNREEPGLDEKGNHRWLLTTKVPLTDSQGQHVGLVGMARDITDRKRVEMALRENESKLRAIYEGTNDAIMLLNEQGFFDCNPQTLKLFHVESKEAFARLHPSDLSPAFQPSGQDSTSASQQKIQTAFQQGYNRFEWVHRRTTGEDFPAEVLLSAFEYSGQQVLQATVRDITERKQAEVDLAQSAEKQQKLTQRLRATIEATDELMRIAEPDRLYRRAVELAREKLGVERCGLWLADSTRQFMQGTYGTDGQGRTTDERGARDPVARHPAMYLSQEKIWAVNEETAQQSRAGGGEETVGIGWVAGTTIRSMSGPIGVMYNDAALSRSPVDPDLQETLAVYCSMLGRLIERQQADTTLQQTIEQQQQQWRRLRAVLEATDELIRITDLDLLYRRAVELAREKLDIERCGMWLMDPTRQYLLGTYGTDTEGRTVDERTAKEPIEAHPGVNLFRDKLWFINETRRVYYKDGKEVEAGTGWVVGTSLRSAKGPIGVLYNDAAISGAPIDEELQNQFALYCSMVGNIIENKRLEQSIRESLVRRSMQVQTSIEVAQHVAAAPELEELFHRVVTLIKERFNYYHVQLFRYMPAEDAVKLIAGYGEIGQKMLAAGHQLTMGHGVVGTAAATGQSILATDVSRDLDWRPNPNLPDTQGELAVPIKMGGGDAESQINALKYFVRSNMDGVAITAIDPEAIARITHEALQRGKPVVAISADLKQDNQSALVFSVEHEMGHLLGVQAGNWAKQHVPSDQNVKLGMLNYRTLPQVRQREQGIIDGIQSVIGERVTIVASGSAIEAKEAAYLAQSWLRDHPDLNMIVAINDATALGAYQAAQILGRDDPDQFFIGGIDAVPEALVAIQQGGVYQATVNQSPEVMGLMAVRTLVAAIKGVPVKPVYTLYCTAVNRSNVAKFSGSSRKEALFANQDIIPAEAFAGLDVSGLRLGLSVLTLANPFFAALAQSAQEEAQRLGVQLIINDPSHVLGVLDVQSDQANTLTDDDRLLLEGLCGQIASAMDSTRLLEQLRRSESELSEALKIAKLAHWEYDVEKDLFLFNEQFYSIFHMTAEQAGGYQLSSAQYAQKFVHPDDLPMVGAEIEKALNSTDRHYTRQLEHRILYADGGVGYISVNVNIDRDEQGRILRYYGANQDITERRRAEDRLQELFNNVQQSEQLLRTILEAVPDNLYVKNRKSEFILANKSVLNQLRCQTLEELAGKTDFDFYPHAMAEKFYKDEQALFESGQPIINVEEPSLDAQGRPAWRMTTKVFFHNEAGEIAGLVGLGRNITERKRIEAERERFVAEQQRRAVQLQTASEVSRAASSILNAEELLPQAAELIRARFGFYYVGIFLTDEAKRWAVLQAGTGSAGQQMLANKHRLEVGGNSMIGQCIFTQQAQIALDVGEEAVHFDNPLLPLTHSEIALPLISRGHIMGAMTIQSDQSSAFTVDDITVLQSMADQIANAVENAHLYERAQTALSDTDDLLRASGELNVSQNYDDVLAMLREHTPLGRDAQAIAINVFDRPWTVHQTPQWIELIGYSTRRTTGMEIGTRFPLAVFASARSLLRADAPTLLEDLRTAEVDPATRALFVKQLGAKSVIFVPLVVGGQWIGYINVLFAEPTQFREAEVRRLEALVGQAAVAVQNMRNLAGAQQALTETEASYHATQAIGRAQSTESILEAATPVVQLLGMTQAVLRMVTRRDLNGVISANDCYTYHWLDDQWVLQPILKDAAVNDFAALRPLLRNPEEVMIYKDAQNPESFMPDVVRQALLAGKLQSAVATSITIQGEVMGFLMFSGPQALTETAEQRIRLTVRTLSDQMAVALQNRQLFEQTRAALEEVDAINRRLTGEAWEAYLHQQVGREVIRAADDESAAPETLVKLDEQLAAGEITLEADPENAAEGTVTAPILLRGQPIGALRLRTPLSEWNEDTEALLNDVAGHIAQAVENARLVEQTQRTAQRERTINEINARVRQSVDLDAILRTAVNELGQSLKVARVIARVGTTTAEGAPAPGDGRGKTND